MSGTPLVPNLPAQLLRKVATLWIGGQKLGVRISHAQARKRHERVLLCVNIDSDNDRNTLARFGILTVQQSQSSGLARILQRLEIGFAALT
jgi:hypothetical protein